MSTTWLDRNEYPFESKYRNINGHRMHYIDEGAGETILFVHGTPSWSFDFRNVIKKLSSRFRCVAIDHVGFGLSDKPEVYDYSTHNHSKTLEQFVVQKDLRDVTLVVHDFGGPIGLNMAMRQAHRIKKIIVLNSWLWSAEENASYKKMKPVLKSPLLLFLYRYLNFSPRFLLPASFGEIKLKTGLKTQFTKPFSKPSERNGLLAFAHSLLHDQKWFEKLWQERVAIQKLPALFIWGLKDKFITPDYLEKFQSGFTNHVVVKLETCGHFPQEEQPEAVTRAIEKFLAKD